MVPAGAETSKHSGVTVIRLGDGYDAVDESNVEQVNEFLLDLAQTADPPWLVIDLSRISFFASSFIEGLFRVWNRLNRRAGRFALCGLTEYCAEVLRVARLDTLWDVYPDVKTAVEALTDSANEASEQPG